MKEVTGNIKPGKIWEFIVKALGEDVILDYVDAYLDQCRKNQWPTDILSVESFGKKLNRLYKEKDIDYEELAYHEGNSEDLGFFINGCAARFITDFGAPELALKEIITLYPTLLRIFSSIPPELPQKYTWVQLLHLHLSDALHTPGMLKEDFLYLLRPADELYRELCEVLATVESFPGWEQVYTICNPGADDNEKFEKIFYHMRKEGKNPGWANFKSIFSVVSSIDEATAHWMLLVWMKNNVRNALKQVAGFSEAELQQVKDAAEQFITTGNDTFKDLYSMPAEQIVHTLSATKTACDAIFRQYHYKNDAQQTAALIADIREHSPDSALFFENWFKGWIEVAKENFAGAKNYYAKAFEDGRHYAGGYLYEFLKQASILCLYTEANTDKVRKAMDPNKQDTSPVGKGAKKYWNYGYALNLFDKTADQAFTEFFYRYELFWQTFSPAMHMDSKKAFKRFQNDIDLAWGRRRTGDVQESSQKELNEAYANLARRTDSDDPRITTSIQRKYPWTSGKLYPPLALCMLHGPKEDRFLDLAENWLGIAEGSVPFEHLLIDDISDVGSNALMEALTMYKYFRFIDAEKLQTEQRVQFTEKEARYKALIMRIIEKCTLESFRETGKSSFHTLQIAFWTGDLDIVKALVEKGFDIQNAIIGPDEVSPLYEALMYYSHLYDPEKSFNRMLMLNENGDYINYQKYAAPGITETEKREWEQLIQRVICEMADEIPDFWKWYEAWYIGEEGTWKRRERELFEIIRYLISQMDDVDAFIKACPDGTGCTALYFAAEIDNPELSRMLLEAGANPTMPLGVSDSGWISIFMDRAMAFGSTKVLEMFRRDYPEAALEADRLNRAQMGVSRPNS